MSISVYHCKVTHIIPSRSIRQVFFSVIIGIFSLGQAVPHLEKFVSAAGASVAVYGIIDQVRGIAVSSTILKDG